ncbi:MAG: hypothetical protein AAB401_06160, partial [Acidobacteriota bacterium]
PAANPVTSRAVTINEKTNFFIIVPPVSVFLEPNFLTAKRGEITEQTEITERTEEFLFLSVYFVISVCSVTSFISPLSSRFKTLKVKSSLPRA